MTARRTSQASRDMYQASKLLSFIAAFQRGGAGGLARRTGRYAVRRAVWKTLPFPFGGKR